MKLFSERITGSIKTSLFLSLLTALLLFPLSDVEAATGGKEIKKVEESKDVLKELMAIPEDGVSATLLSKAYGIAVIPGAVKMGILVGGRFGRGILLVRGGADGWSDPSFITITGGSLGLQLGAQTTDLVLVFKSRRSIDGIIMDKFTIGADASIALGPVGRSAEAATDSRLRAEVYSYSRSRGFFAGVSFNGASLEIDHDSNAGFYGVDYIEASDILYGKHPEPPSVAAELKDMLKGFIKRTER